MSVPGYDAVTVFSLFQLRLGECVIKGTSGERSDLCFSLAEQGPARMKQRPSGGRRTSTWFELNRRPLQLVNSDHPRLRGRPFAALWPPVVCSVSEGAQS